MKREETRNDMSKYRANRVMYDGILFASQKECERYIQLKWMEKAGEISNLRLQVKYELVPAQYYPAWVDEKGKHHKEKLRERAVNYIADFEYYRDGTDIVEDVKGYKGGESYKVFAIKRKLMLWRYGIQVIEV